MSMNEINLISLRNFYLIRNLRHSFIDQRQTAEKMSLKIIVSPDIACTFLLFKAGACLQIFFPKHYLTSFEKVSFSQ